MGAGGALGVLGHWRYHVRRLAVSLSLISALLMAIGSPVIACGFHTVHFRTNFYDDWNTIKRTAFPRRGVGNQSVEASVIQELIRILKYVDPYNYAPDSPPWMVSEEGRLDARESAIEILHQIGKRAASAVAEALVCHIRYDTPGREFALTRIRKKRDIEEELTFKMLEALRRFPERLKAWQAASKSPDMPIRVFRAWFQLIQRLPLPVEQPKAVRANRRQGRGAVQPAHRVMSRDRYNRLVFSNFARQRLDLPSFIANHPQTAADRELKFLRDRYAAARKATMVEVSRFNGQEQARFRAARVPVIGGGSDLVPCEDFAQDLETVLVRIGKPALPALKKVNKWRSRKAMDKIKQIIGIIEGQENPIEPAGLQPVADGGAGALAELALLLWDLGDPKEDAKHVKQAQEALSKRGKSAVPDILQIMAIPQLELRDECAKALSLLTGEQLGLDLQAWRDWYREREAVLKAEAILDSFDGDLMIGNREQPPGKAPKPPKLDVRTRDERPPAKDVAEVPNPPRKVPGTERPQQRVEDDEEEEDARRYE